MWLLLASVSRALTSTMCLTLERLALDIFVALPLVSGSR